MFILWISVFLFFLLTEMGFPGSFFALSISYGALVALFMDFFDISTRTQVSSFLVAAVVGFFKLRYIVSKIQSKKHFNTGAEKLKGIITVMLSESEIRPGTVHVAGTTWSAVSVHHERICAGELVRIIDVKSTLLFVERVKQEENTCITSQ